jgi:hypothetical protein
LNAARLEAARLEEEAREARSKELEELAQLRKAKEADAKAAQQAEKLALERSVCEKAAEIEMLRNRLNGDDEELAQLRKTKEADAKAAQQAELRSKAEKLALMRQETEKLALERSVLEKEAEIEMLRKRLNGDDEETFTGAVVRSDSREAAIQCEEPDKEEPVSPSRVSVGSQCEDLRPKWKNQWTGSGSKLNLSELQLNRKEADRSSSRSKAAQTKVAPPFRTGTRPGSRGRRSPSPGQPQKPIILDEVSMSAERNYSRVFADADAAALHLMHLADSHSRNGSLTVTEMQTFLSGTPHQEFMRWITKSKQLLAFDRDRSGTIEQEELRHALHEFWNASVAAQNKNKVRSKSPPALPRKPPPPAPEEKLQHLQLSSAEVLDSGDLERVKLQGALRQYREQDYDLLLASKTREIEALQRRTEEKMAKLGQVRRTSPSMTLVHCFDREPQPADFRLMGNLATQDTELPSSSELATRMTDSAFVLGTATEDIAGTAFSSLTGPSWASSFSSGAMPPAALAARQTSGSTVSSAAERRTRFADDMPLWLKSAHSRLGLSGIGGEAAAVDIIDKGLAGLAEVAPAAAMADDDQARFRRTAADQPPYKLITNPPPAYSASPWQRNRRSTIS